MNVSIVTWWALEFILDLQSQLVLGHIFFSNNSWREAIDILRRGLSITRRVFLARGTAPVVTLSCCLLLGHFELR